MTPSEKPHILFIPTWYPHRYDSMAGLFVRKHALSVSPYAKITVLYLHEDKSINSVQLVDQQYETLREIYIYYPKKRLCSLPTYRKAFNSGWKYVVEHCGMPNLVHVNVLGKAGLSAYMLYRRYHIPYVVTEHWTGYLPINFRYKGFMRKRLTELVVRNAKCIMPVSENLASTMRKLGLKGNYRVVNNVVDDFFYNRTKPVQNSPICRFVHISCFDDNSKNISGLLAAVESLKKIRTDFQLSLIGTGQDFDRIKSLAAELGVEDKCRFLGELQPNDVADTMLDNDVMVMFSNYENAPVVISEALAMGMPVVATQVGGIAEMVGSNEGILIEPRDTAALCQVMESMCDRWKEYNQQSIKQVGMQYSFSEVGKQLNEIYFSVLND